MAPKAKRLRTDELPTTKAGNSSKVKSDGLLPKCHLTRLPLELLAEILSYTPSPRDILALARTSKHFCSVLVNNRATEFVWREARARFLPHPIPDPTSNWTEASFAAMLFDSRMCEVCGCKTKEVYWSFALRATICGKEICMTQWRKDFIRRVDARDRGAYPEFLQWIPRVERVRVRDIVAPLGDLSADVIYVRQSVWDQAVNECNKVHLLGDEAVAAYVKEKQPIADALPIMIEFYAQLTQWGIAYNNSYRQILRQNHASATLFAKQNGWNVEQLLHTPTYHALYHTKGRNLELVASQDQSRVLELVSKEIADIKVREARREKELAQRQRINQVRSAWKDIKSKARPVPVLPSLNEFRTLPVVKIFETVELASKTTRTLQDPFVSSVLAENLEQWRETARAALAGVLGFPTWKNLSKGKLHPVDRLTARFRCKRCDKAGSGKKPLDDGGMDFARACDHVCGHLQKKTSSKERWTAEWFVPDQRAIDAISQVLALCNTSPADADSLRIADELGSRVQCQSCACVMDVWNVGRHCKRHVDCSFIMANTTAEPPIEYGLASQLLKVSVADRDLKIYICRHCAHSPPTDIQGTQANRLMTFNGLRSHVKEKHLITSIADEDFFQKKDTAASASPINAVTTSPPP